MKVNSQYPPVDFCVVNYNTLSLTKACLHLLQTATKDLNSTVWVVDNDSTDGSADFLRTLDWIKLIERKVETPEEGHVAHGRACEMVFEKSDSEYLFLIHSDTMIYDKQGLHLLLDQIINDKNIAAVGCVDQVYHGFIGHNRRFFKRYIKYHYRRIKSNLGLKAKPAKHYQRTYIRSFFSVWNIGAMKREGLKLFMENKNPGYHAQDSMTLIGYKFLALPPKKIFQYVDHLEAATISAINPYHRRHRKSALFKRKMKRALRIQ